MAASRSLVLAAALLCASLVTVFAKEEGDDDPSESDVSGEFKHGYWKRDVSYNDVNEADFKRDADPRLKAKDGELVVTEQLVPKFRWAQDKRQVLVTIMVKNLENGTLSVDDNWLNYSAVGDIQRVVTSHHFKQEQQEQLSQKAPYGVQLPLKFKIMGNRTRQQIEQGYTTFVLRKATKGKEWKHLLKEPALATYKKQMRMDWKKYDVDKDDDEFLVSKVNAQNIDQIVSAPGLVLVQFCPTWSDKAAEWAKQYGGAADLLEDEARLAKVNVLKEPEVAAKYGITMSQRDENPKPQYAVFVDGIQQALTYDGETDTTKLVDFVRRLTVPPATELQEKEDVVALLKELTFTPTAILLADSADSSAVSTFKAAARQLQIVGKPLVSAGVITDLGSNAAAYLTELNADLKEEIGTRILLLLPQDTDKLPVSEQNPDGVGLMRPPAVVSPDQNGLKFDADGFTSVLAGWGYRAAGLTDSGHDETALLEAQKLGVTTVYVHTKEATSRNESKLCAACPTAVAAVKEVLLEGDLTGFRGVGVSGGHVKGSTAQGLATSHGLKGDIFPAVSLVGSDGRRYAFSSAEADEGMITAAGVRSFLNSFQAGTLAQALRSEPAPVGDLNGAGSGRVDKVVGLTVGKFVSGEIETSKIDGGLIDRVLVIHSSEDRKSYKKNVEKVAEKLTYVPTLAFGSLDLEKNEMPAEIKLFPADSAPGASMEGIWLFPANAGADTLPLRAKRKAKLGEIASWLKKTVTSTFEAKAPSLPAGTYQDSCTGCRVHKLASIEPALNQLVCADCPGAESSGSVTLDLTACADKPITNENGLLDCPEPATEVEEGADGKAGETEAAAASAEMYEKKEDDKSKEEL